MDHEEKENLTEQQTAEAAAEAAEPETAPEAEPAAEAPEEEADKKDGPSAEELAARVAELEDQLLRKIAEFDNYRRRTTKEKEEIGLTARIKCVSELLPILDNFERALKIGCSDENFFKGVKMIFDTMTAAFTKMGVEEIEAEGKPFDPELHYAVSRVENPDLGANVVSAVMQKGYRMNGKIIRHAMVAVANPD